LVACCCALQAVTAADNGTLMTVKQLYYTSVAILDTGIDCNHVDLNISFAKSFKFERVPNPAMNPACFDGNGHGTHVAGEPLGADCYTCCWLTG